MLPKLEPHDDLERPDGGVHSWGGARNYALLDLFDSQASEEEEAGHTYSMANFRGSSANTGSSVKQITKHAAAARLNAPKISSRSHLLTELQMASASISVIR